MQQQHAVSWNIDSFTHQALAHRFAQNIKDFFSIYSPTLRHIYGTYTIDLLRGPKSRLVAVPSIYSLDRYINIPESALRRSGLYIFPGDFFNLRRHRFVATFMKRDLTLPKNPKIGRPSTGFDLLRKFCNNHSLFPVITNGDLHEFRSTTPCLHVHLVDLRKLSMSNLDRGTLKSMLEENQSRFKSIDC